LAFNILLVFLPAIGLFYFQVYENELLESQEQSMVQQGRLLAAALSGSRDLAQDASMILDGFYPETISRLRIIDHDGWVLADSSRAGPPSEFAREVEDSSVTDQWLYKIGQTLFNFVTRTPTSQPDIEPEPTYDPLEAPEIIRALQGSYGANWRVSPGQRSVTLYSAIPIRQGEQVLGAVLVSQSTFRVLQKLYSVRLTIFKIVLASVLVAFALSFVVAKTIASPLQDLKRKASGIVERREALGDLFDTSTRLDEIGDLERALAELSHRLGDRIRFIESFASDLSHELKNPLAAVRTATELLHDVHDQDDRRRFLEVIETEVARMEHLISRVREVTFVDSNIEREVRQPLCLNHFLKEFLEGLELLHGGAVRLRLERPSSLVYVKVSPDRLTQVMENLLDNAISFSADGSPIDVHLREEERWAIVSVRDFGPGIKQEDQERVFDRFFSNRTAEAGSRSHHVGLGLAIVRAIVEGYGGKVLARNAPDGGAVLEFRLRSTSNSS
jgi:two-component system sensor histidine kinase ChvG